MTGCPMRKECKTGQGRWVCQGGAEVHVHELPPNATPVGDWYDPNAKPVEEPPKHPVHLVIRARKKPVEIEAMLFDGSEASGVSIRNWVGYLDTGEGDGMLFIRTLQGTMPVQPGDYIIKGIAGEFYPCKPDIFLGSYEVL